MNNLQDQLHVNPGSIQQSPPPDLDVYKVQQALLRLEEHSAGSTREALEALGRVTARSTVTADAPTPAAAAKPEIQVGASSEQLRREFTEQVAPTATINMWRDLINSWADVKGWNDASIMEADGKTIRHEFIGEQLMLMVTELAEAQEDNRTGKMSTYLDEMGKPCGFPSELADTIIRILHLCGRMQIDIGFEMAIKMGFNYSRARRHGGLRS